jgi:hypothetical protein
MAKASGKHEGHGSKSLTAVPEVLILLAFLVLRRCWEA